MFRAVLPVLMLLACNGDKDVDPVDDTDAVTDDTDDTNPPGPTIPTVTISPSHGQQGVLIDTPIILSFSEPMNTASVEAAWASSSFVLADVSSSWNDACTVWTINGNTVLDYPRGGFDVDRYGYEIALDGTAQDAEGDMLAAVSITFDTARDITDTLPLVTARTGSFNGTVTTPVLRPGDTDTNATWRAWMSFDLSVLPDDVISLEDAILGARQASTYGDPYGDLGAIYPVLMPGILGLDDAAAYTANGVGGTSLARDGTVGDKTANVREALQSVLDGGATEVAVRVGFDTAFDLEGDDDYAVFEDPTLTVHLLAK